jgi:uncharacterized MAPEG superfamily protein
MSIAYWCVLAAALLPSFTVAIAKGKGRGAYDNRDPRAVGTYKGLAYRAYAAHQNGLETFPFFAIAVLVASGGAVHAVIPVLDALALAWIGLRLAYIAAYLLDRPNLRSIVWVIALFLTVAIFTLPAWHA